MIKWMRIAILSIFAVVAVAFLSVKFTGRITSDTHPPIITADSDEIILPVKSNDEDLMNGMSAYDNRDKDVTGSMVVVSRSKFIRPGVCNVNYAAFDSHNNVGTYTRRVTYSDYHSPEFSLTVPLIYSMSERNVDYLANVKATDVLDGDLSTVVRMNSGVMQTSENGTITMPLDLQVTNTFGDTQELELEVVYLDEVSYQQDRPSLSQYIVYTQPGEKVDAAAYLDGICNGKNKRLFEVTGYSADNVVIDDSAVNYVESGVYRIHYTLYPTGGMPSAETGDTGMSLGSCDLFVVIKEAL